MLYGGSLSDDVTSLLEGRLDVEEMLFDVVEDLIDLPGSVGRLIFAIIRVPLNFLDHLIELLERAIRLWNRFRSGTWSRIDCLFSLLAVNVASVFEDSLTDAALVGVALCRTVWRLIVDSLAVRAAAPVASEVEAFVG